ncbi:MAG: hypothetical protein K940chlam3_01092 [Chlamydiae bacterium]|nr:hypothetical protein [Chlamydiota bacterium]
MIFIKCFFARVNLKDLFSGRRFHLKIWTHHIKHCTLLTLFLMMFMLHGAAHANLKFWEDCDKWASVGAGIRSSFRGLENRCPEEEHFYFKDFVLDNARLYFSGQIHPCFQVDLNTDFDRTPFDLLDETDRVRILDAQVRFRMCDAFNIWFGRNLIPSDRYNMDGPFYLATYEFPIIVSRYPSIFAGRDNGFNIHGEFQGGKFKYAFGIYEGKDRLPVNGDNLLYATRLTINFWDPIPGYYTSSTYYGEKNVFAVAFVAQYQKDRVRDLFGNVGKFLGYNIDVLIERRVEHNEIWYGVITLEGAVYHYDFDAIERDGEAYLLLVGYLFPCKVWLGRFQPHVRYQKFRNEKQWDAGVNYVIMGHDGYVSLIYSRINPINNIEVNRFLLGVQFQY